MAGGRKLSFNKELALEAAMQVFWQKGYVGASLSDLTQAMGINKPSMYSTFGNKEALFTQATNLYVEQQAAPHLQWLYKANMTIEKRIKEFLMSTVVGQCQNTLPKGCYISACINESSNDTIPRESRQLIVDLNQHMQTELERLLREDEESKSQGYDKRANEIALSLNSLLCGTATMAKAGRNEKELESVVNAMLLGLGLVESREPFW
ncbi:MAG: hypothetical protein Alis3KO_13200 [Aliiglaciecola sp.]